MVLIIAIVAVCALFAGMYIAGGQDDDSDDVVAVNNTTEENKTVDSVETTQSQDTSSSSDSGNYTHRMWSEQDGAYIYVDDEGYYKDGYIISEDENGKISAIKDTRGDE